MSRARSALIISTSCAGAFVVQPTSKREQVSKSVWAGEGWTPNDLIALQGAWESHMFLVNILEQSTCCIFLISWKYSNVFKRIHRMLPGKINGRQLSKDTSYAVTEGPNPCSNLEESYSCMQIKYVCPSGRWSTNTLAVLVIVDQIAHHVMLSWSRVTASKI